MKTLKITEEAWKRLSIFKTYNNIKTLSEAIETAISYANLAPKYAGIQFRILEDEKK